MYFNAAIEGKVGANWILAYTPYALDQVADWTTLSILAGVRSDFPAVALRGRPADMSAGLAAMQATLGSQKFSYLTLEEMRGYMAFDIGERVMQREIATGQAVKEIAPLYVYLVERMMVLAARFGLSRDSVRLVYGFD